MADLKKAYAFENMKIRDVMEVITNAAMEGLPSGIALIVDNEEKLIGVVTDGDIRKSLLKGYNLDDLIKDIIIRDPILFSKEQSYKEILSEIPRKIKEKTRYRKRVVEKIIIVDKEKKVVELLNFYDLWIKQQVMHKNVCVLGLGFVGLTLALALADVGYKIYGLEKDEEIKNELISANSHFYEPGIDTLLRYHLGKNFIISSEISPENDIYIICVGTPLNEKKEPEMEHLKIASQEVGSVLKYGDLVILRSTVPIGTTRNFVLPILEKESGLSCGKDFYLSFAPERTIEGKALYELRTLPQVIGGFDQNSTDITSSFFRELTPSIVSVDSLEEAEFIKLLNNSFRDTKFSFANEFSLICEKYNINATKVIMAANEGYPRDKIPVPSPGVGGYCLTKDPYFYAKAARDAGLLEPLSEIGRNLNEKIPEVIFEKIEKTISKYGKKLENSKIFCIGFAFKGEPETSDIRGSTTIDLLKYFSEKCKNICGYDPVVEKEKIEMLNVKYTSIEEGFKDADIAIFMNNHRSYQEINIFKCLDLMNKPAILCDYWYIFPTKMVKQIEGVIHIVPGMIL